MAITYYASNRILDRNFGGVSYVVPSTLYVGLSTTSISSDGTGATEPSGGAYARVGATNDKTTWSNAATGALTNLITITFAESTAAWGTIVSVFLSDALTSGNIWYYDTLSPTRTVQANTTVLFAPSAITVQMINA